MPKILKSKRVLVLLFNKFVKDSRVLKECTTLVHAGYNVELWASYSEELPETEMVNGFLVKRIFGRPKNNSLFSKFKRHVRVVLKRIILFLPFRFEFLIKRPIEWMRTGIRNFKKRSNGLSHPERYVDLPFDIIHCNDLAPLDLAIEIKRKNKGMKLIYDCHEYETEGAGLVNNPPKKLRYQLMEKEYIHEVDEVITVAPSIAHEYKTLYGLDKVHVVKNVPEFSSSPINLNYFRNYFTLKDKDILFLYQGALLKGVRGVEETLSVFERLSHEGFKDHHIIFMGFGALETNIKKQSKKFPNVHFHPAVPPLEISQVSSSADYGILFLQNYCKSYFYSLPNKLFEYIMCGLPVISSPLFEIQKIVVDQNIGFITNDFTEEALFNVLRAINKQPNIELRKKIQTLHRDFFNWNLEKEKLLSIYKGLES